MAWKTKLFGQGDGSVAGRWAYRERLLIQLSSQMRVPCIPQASPVECSSKCNLIANYLRAKFTSPMGSGIVKHLGGVWIPFFNHSISVTHHSSLKIPYSFGTITHLSLLNIFHTICGPHTCHSVQPFFSFQYHWTQLKKKKKKRNPDQKEEEEAT